MKKTYFQSIFNTCLILFATALFCILCLFVLSFGMYSLQNIAYLSFLYRLISTLNTFCSVILLIATASFTVLFAHEFQFRRENDNLTNIWKSIKQTLSIRSFLKQSELSETMITVKEEKVTRYNPINKQFNQTVHKAVIDIQKDKAVVLIKIPKTQQATKLLKEMETLISEEISSYNPDYYFSQPQRKGKWLCFIGTKRK